MSHVEEVLNSYTTPPYCSDCGGVSEHPYYCWGCGSWTCLKCSKAAKLTVTRLMHCVDCRVKALKLHRTTEAEPDFEWYSAMARLAAGTQHLSTLGGSFRYRTSSIPSLMRWGKQWGLEVLPGSPIVYEHFIGHRLLVEGVSIATVELDMIAISIWHSYFKATIPGLWWHNPTKQDLIRVLLKHLSKRVKLSAKVTVPFSYINFVIMINSLTGTDCITLHCKIALQIVGLGGLRRVAAVHLWLRRHSPAEHSLQFKKDSDILVIWIEEFGWCTALHINFDKNIPAGAWRWVWIPGIMVCGLSLGQDIRFYLTRYAVPDGPFLAAPTGSRGRSWRSTVWSGLDRAVARTYAGAFPGRSSVGVAPYSLRKMIIQALHTWARRTGKFTDGDIGEFIGWVSKKTDIMKHYSGMDAKQQMRMLSEMDPKLLPAEVSTSGVGPKDWT